MLVKGTPVGAGSSAWTSGWTAGRAWGDEGGGACTVLASLWLKRQNRQFKHPTSATVFDAEVHHQNVNITTTEQ